MFIQRKYDPEFGLKKFHTKIVRMSFRTIKWNGNVNMIGICIYCIIAPIISWIYISIHSGSDVEKIEIIRRNCIKSKHPNCSLFANGSDIGHIFEVFGHLPNFSYDYKIERAFQDMWPTTLVFSGCMLIIVVVGWIFFEWSEGNCSIYVFYAILLAHMTIYEMFKPFILSPYDFYTNTNNLLYEMNFGFDLADDNKSVYKIPYFNKTSYVTNPVSLFSISYSDILYIKTISNTKYPFSCLSRDACDRTIFNRNTQLYCFLRSCLKTNCTRIENSLPLDLDLYKVYPSYVSNITQIIYHGPAMNQSKTIYLIIFAVFVFIMFHFKE